MSNTNTTASDSSFESPPTATSLFENREFVLVSNREPYTHERDDGSITVVRPAGGLTSALDPMMASTGGTWVAWGSGGADDEASDENGCVRVPPESPSYELKRVSLTEEQVRNYYYGYSNKVLWPLCHSDTAKVTSDARFWRQYRETNRQFAAAVRERTDPSNAVIWFQDYHFALAPRYIRDQSPGAFCMQFWHIPWPSWDVFQSCPQYEELLDGLLANDLLGFHLDQYCQNFLDCVSHALDADVDRNRGRIDYDGRTVRVAAFPLGIDTAERRTLAEGKEAGEQWESLRKTYRIPDEGQLALGVDRLDYTKGIEQRLAALEHLWEWYPDCRERLTYVQKATESRSRIDEYQHLQANVGARVERINDRFGTETWQPVISINDHLPQSALAALYREADICLVSSLRDGMNLVAKEFVASQVADPGVLVLSELVGAHEELGESALTVHPNDTEAFAATVDQARMMEPEERSNRMRRLREQVETNDIEQWKRNVLREASDILHGC
ncbi:alpha,alpha-trehalose-phosphate synthase (UDP-forming) [Haladaptatus sp. DFWS20]|uniref:alpha,alpha-trehalose-phosphate synthase (UDP-forming) n=1 Tax=Haladaptatus sp. DFWS20 TaxID=3403467 RepID=UPI003EB78DAB